MSKQAEYACLLVNNGNEGDFDYLLALDAVSVITDFDDLKNKKNKFLFGHFGYDLKNSFEALQSVHIDLIGFPDIYFFEPKYILKVISDEIILEHEETEDVQLILNTLTGSLSDFEKINSSFKIIHQTSRPEYIANANKLKQHIKRGDIYEVNYCINFFAKNAVINPEEKFFELNKISQSPFAAYYKLKDKYLLCSSPERFLKKRGNKILSQPIKGTRKRGKTVEEDAIIVSELRNNLKEQNENVMIVDLVRNDLSRVAKRGTVRVDELFGIYTFRQVHQMISTISCELKDDYSFIEAIRNTFPMGSMTGAPKIRAMQLIEEYENFKRGLYSGSIGYITPDNDFDFNVVIRSILYNHGGKCVTFAVGSALTDKALAEEEYDECLLKARAMFEVLHQNS